MKFRIFMATATAASVLMTVGAMAGSGNTLYIDQDGTANSAAINQDRGNDSTFGLSGDRALQDGDNNRINFDISNWGTNNDNDVEDFLQEGNWNLFGSAAAGGSSNNSLLHFTQDGNQNSARINWVNNSNSTVDTVSVVGNKNALTIYQGSGLYAPSSGNVVSLVSILGDNNGIATGNEWAHGDWGAASYIEQLGTNNKITLSSIEGSNNHAPNPWAPGAFNRVHEIIQKGSNNGLVASTASTLGSDYNWIKVYEEGSGNNFSVTQGISLDSTHNFATVNQIGNDNGATFSQLGSFNTASTSQDGNGNLITIQQISDGNTATTSFVGDENGAGSFTGGAVGTLIAAHPGKLVQGTIEQDSTGFATGNLVEYDVVGSENLFAFTQEGGNNKIFGGVGDTGDASSFNEAAVLQVGANNTTSFSQMGGSNILAVAQ